MMRVAGGILLAVYLLLFIMVMGVIIILECFDFSEKPTIFKPKRVHLS